MPSLLEDIKKFLKTADRKEASQFIDQLLKEKTLSDALREAGLPYTLEEIQSRARTRPEGVLTHKEILDQIDKITEIVKVLTIDLIKVIERIEEILIIKTIETIGNMPDPTPRGSEGVAFKQATAPAGAWKSPTGFEDPDNGWSSEANAYDEDTESYAREDFVAPYSWSSFLYLTINAMKSSKIQVYAEKYHATIDKIDIDVYRNGAWTHVYQGSFPDKEWVEHPFNEGIVTKARVRFYSSSSGWNYAYLNEFDFWEVPATGGELATVLYAWDTSAYQKVRCDPDGYLLTKAAP